MEDETKPTNRWPMLLRRILRRVLPRKIYLRHIGRHEEMSLEVWKRLVKGLSQSGHILDVGAFRGEFSLAARELDATATVIAFEPERENFETLRSEARGTDIILVNKALSDRVGTTTFISEGARSRIGEGAGAATEVTTIDAWMKSFDGGVSLIKLDTEGQEGAILRGGKAVVGRDRPSILAEVLTTRAGSEVAAALPENYTFWFIEENRGILQVGAVERRTWRDKNYLLVPAEKVGSLREWMEGLVLGA